MKKRTQQKVRNLKVYTTCNNPIYSKRSILPEIRLKGSWLKNWGFDCGNDIKIIKTDFGLSIIKVNQKIPVLIL